MRMGAEGPSAADVVNTMEPAALARIIAVLGEEKKAKRVASGHRQGAARSEAVGYARTRRDRRRRGRQAFRRSIHPATRTFQALRIFVNRELEELAEALAASERILGEGGRLVVVAFHSLEDRIVKRFLADRSARTAGGSRHMPEQSIAAPTFALLSRGTVEAGEAEIRRNPRARSARLRAARRTQAPARPLDPGAIGVPSLPAFGPGRG